jgi:hypothetical protein
VRRRFALLQISEAIALDIEDADTGRRESTWNNGEGIASIVEDRILNWCRKN